MEKINLLTANEFGETPSTMSDSGRRIEYLSRPTPVNMGDWWFDLACSNHFWIRRRFDVMKKLADPMIRRAKRVAEVGCGHGLLQKGLEEYYGIPVAGFELNDLALKKNISRCSPLCCYDIHDRLPRFCAHFDLILLFDVLEHIEDESSFLQSVRFHLADSGVLLVNVPAIERFRSDYDRCAGHVRRYSASQLKRVLERNGFRIESYSYWGLPLVPLLLARKAIHLRNGDGSSGFDPKWAPINKFLGILSRMEPLPQHLLGTSVMIVAEKQS